MNQASFGYVVADKGAVFDTAMTSHACDPSNPSVMARWTTTLPTLPTAVWVFLTGNAPLPAGKVLSVYVADGASAQNGNFLFLGCVDTRCPSGKFVVPCGAFSTQFERSAPSLLGPQQPMPAAGGAAGAGFGTGYGQSSSFFGNNTPAAAPAACSNSTSNSDKGGSVLGFCLEDQATAQHHAMSTASSSQQTHNDFVMRLGASMTSAANQCIATNGALLAGNDPNGSDSTIVVSSKAVDRFKVHVEKAIELNISQFI